MHRLPRVELDPLFSLLLDQLGKSRGGSKVKAMGNRIGSSVSQYPRETLKEKLRLLDFLLKHYNSNL